MSFLSDLFHGNFGNLGEDIAPQNIFKDFGSSFANQPTWAKALEIALPAVALGGVGLGALADVGAVGAGAAAEGGLGAAEAAGAGFDLGTIGPGVAGAEFADPTAAALAAGGGESAALPASSEVAALGGTGGGYTVPGSTFVPTASGMGMIAPDTNPALLGTIDPALGQTGPTVADTLTSTSLGGGDFSPIAATTGGAPGGGATTAADAPNLFGPGPSVFQTGAPATPFAGVTGGAAPAGAVGAEGPGVLSSIGSALKTAAPFAGVAGLGANLYSGYQSSRALKALQQQETDYQNRIAQAGQASLSAAQPMIATAEALMGTGTGPIPAPMQAILDNYRNGQRARVIQSYTSQGLSGDPNKNTSLMQDLNAVDNQMLALQESIGNQILTTANTMLSQGASATNIAAELPMMMQRLDIALQQQTGNAIANFAAAMSGGTMKVAGQGTGQNINISTGNPLLQ